MTVSSNVWTGLDYRKVYIPAGYGKTQAPCLISHESIFGAIIKYGYRPLTRSSNVGTSFDGRKVVIPVEYGKTQSICSLSSESIFVQFSTVEVHRLHEAATLGRFLMVAKCLSRRDVERKKLHVGNHRS